MKKNITSKSLVITSILLLSILACGPLKSRDATLAPDTTINQKNGTSGNSGSTGSSGTTGGTISNVTGASAPISHLVFQKTMASGVATYHYLDMSQGSYLKLLALGGSQALYANVSLFLYPGRQYLFVYDEYVGCSKLSAVTPIKTFHHAYRGFWTITNQVLKLDGLATGSGVKIGNQITVQLHFTRNLNSIGLNSQLSALSPIASTTSDNDVVRNNIVNNLAQAESGLQQSGVCVSAN